jgi:hypothetical protein
MEGYGDGGMRRTVKCGVRNAESEKRDRGDSQILGFEMRLPICRELGASLRKRIIMVGIRNERKENYAPYNSYLSRRISV